MRGPAASLTSSLPGSLWRIASAPLYGRHPVAWGSHNITSNIMICHEQADGRSLLVEVLHLLFPHTSEWRLAPWAAVFRRKLDRPGSGWDAERASSREREGLGGKSHQQSDLGPSSCLPCMCEALLSVLWGSHCSVFDV